jgi:stringent starvation protein B
VDERTVVPREFVRAGEIVLNVSIDATSRLRLGNDLIEFEARFNRVARQLSIPIENVTAIYAAENGHGMAFEVAKSPAEPTEAAESGQSAAVALLSAVPRREPPAEGASADDVSAVGGPDRGGSGDAGPTDRDPAGVGTTGAASTAIERVPGASESHDTGTEEPPPPAGGPAGRPRLTRIK